LLVNVPFSTPSPFARVSGGANDMPMCETVRQRLEGLGRERALIYKTFLLSGLRKGELTALTVGQLYLDEPIPYIALDASEEKNREENEGCFAMTSLRIFVSGWPKNWQGCKWRPEVVASRFLPSPR